MAAFLVLLWALYRVLLHQIAQQFNARLDERTRIARELHDTLLQSFHGLMFRFQAARNTLPRTCASRAGRVESAGCAVPALLDVNLGGAPDADDCDLPGQICQPFLEFRPANTGIAPPVLGVPAPYPRSM